MVYTDGSHWSLKARAVTATLVLASVLLLFTGSARAVPSFFDIFFDEDNNGSIDWTGTYTVDGGVLTQFFAHIGTCPNCDYIDIFPAPNNDDPADGDAVRTGIFTHPFVGRILALNDAFFNPPQTWQILDFASLTLAFPFHSGIYTVTPRAVPEPSTATLLLVGLAGLYFSRRRAGRKVS